MIFLALIIFIKLIFVESHGRLTDPPARSSCWREFPAYCVADFTDNQLFCGGKDVQWNQNDGKCGVCGDNFSGSRTYEKGGKGKLILILK